jgi:hypothetical protein
MGSETTVAVTLLLYLFIDTIFVVAINAHLSTHV